MSAKPDDIPQDVWDAAELVLQQANIKAHMLAEPTDPLDCIAHAIMAERERCAKIAEISHGTATARKIRALHSDPENHNG